MVLLAVILLAGQVRMGIAGSSSEREVSLAKQSAILSLSMAFGRVQGALGPDQRVSALSQTWSKVPGSPPTGATKDFWLGVENLGNPSEPVEWMVSNTRDLGKGREVTLVGGGTVGVSDPSLQVTVETEDLPELSGGFQSEVAYWISDEGTKLSTGFGGRNRTAFEDAVNPGSKERDRLSRMVLSESPIIELLASPQREWIDYTSALILNQVEHLRHLKFLAGDSVAGTKIDEYLGDGFHDFTTRTYGVLASVDGGLKTDLSSNPSALGAGFEAVSNFETYMETPLASSSDDWLPSINDGRRRYKLVAPPSSPSPGQVVHSVAPVITELAVLFQIYRPGKSDRDRNFDVFIDGTYPNIFARIQVFIELWNPYSSALVPEDMILELDLPDVEMVVDTGGSGVIEGNEVTLLELNEIFGNHGSAGSRKLRLDLTFDNPDYKQNWLSTPTGTDSESWLPGRVHSWVGANNWANVETDTSKIGSGNSDDQAAKYAIKLMTQGIWGKHLSSMPWPRLGTSVSGSYAARHGFRSVGGTSSPENPVLGAKLMLATSGDTLVELNDLKFDPFENSPTAFSSTQRATRFGFWALLEERGHEQVSAGDPYARSFWLRKSDPRGSKLTSIYEDPDAHYTAPASEGFDPSAYNYSGDDPPNAFEDFLFDRTTRGNPDSNVVSQALGQNYLDDIPLFELPRQRFLSVGHLQHLHFSGARPFSIGNSWGSEVGANSVFDDYFFSGIRAAGELAIFDPENDPWPHPGLTFVPPQNTTFTKADLLSNPDGVGRFLLSNGAFNINSTSVKAWEGLLLSGGIDRLLRVDFPLSGNSPGGTELPIASISEFVAPVFRFPQSFQEVYGSGLQIGGNRPAYDDRGWSYSASGSAPVHPETEYFRVGVVDLAETYGLDQTVAHYLAREIVDMIKIRHDTVGIFESLEDFLDPVEVAEFENPFEAGIYLSVIESAILKLEQARGGDFPRPAIPLLRRGDTMSSEPIDFQASAFLTQADILGALAPVLSVRSDTFKVRAYGSVGSDGASGFEPSKEAVLEATLQRIPEVVEPGAVSNQTTNPNGWGRRFTLVEMRWLDPQNL